jgi:hypothetical protein
MSHKPFRVTANLTTDVGEVLRLKADRAGRSMSNYVERLIYEDLAVGEAPPISEISKQIPPSDAPGGSGAAKPYPTPPAPKRSSAKKRGAKP